MVGKKVEKIELKFEVDEIQAEYAGCGSHALDVTLTMGFFIDDALKAKIQTRYEMLVQALLEAQGR